jgi:HlyD family type I secretion membrane fusion protein
MLNCPSIDQWHRDVPANVRWPALAGTVVLALWLFGFGSWAAFAPLSGAVVAPGAFVADGQNKHIQHLEGGIVREILVKEGDLVQPGQIVLRLDETASKARLRRLTLRYRRLVGMQARLQGEIAQQDSIEFPPALLQTASDPDVAEIMSRQEMEMKARTSKMNAEVEVLVKEIAGLEEGITGFQAQVNATRDQISLFGEELKDKEDLLRKTLVRKTDVLAVKRAESRSTGELGQLLSRIGDNRERIARASQQIAQIRSSAVQRAVEDLRATETELDDVKEQIRAAEDVVNRNDVVSPIRGIVVKLNYHTAGGVIQPGAAILELVPVNDNLVLETRIAAGEILHVKPGQKALVRLSALNQRLTPMIAGNVAYVSADAVLENDPRKAAAMPGSFVVRVRLDDDDTKSKAPGFRPMPGMPAEVYIQTGERTFFQYIVKPVVDSFSKAFREQ